MPITRLHTHTGNEINVLEEYGGYYKGIMSLLQLFSGPGSYRARPQQKLYI